MDDSLLSWKDVKRIVLSVLVFFIGLGFVGWVHGLVSEAPALKSVESRMERLETKIETLDRTTRSLEKFLREQLAPGD